MHSMSIPLRAIYQRQRDDSPEPANYFSYEEWLERKLVALTSLHQKLEEKDATKTELLRLLYHESIRLGAADPYEEFGETLDEIAEILYGKEAVKKDGD